MKIISNPNSSNNATLEEKYTSAKKIQRKPFSLPSGRVKNVYLRLPSKKARDGTFNPRTKIRNSVLTKRRSYAECYCRENWKR